MSDAGIQQSEIIWKPVPTIPGYECSSDGRLKNIKTQRELTPVKTRDSLVFCVRRDNRQAVISCAVAFKLAFPEKVEKVYCKTCGKEVDGLDYIDYCSQECKQHMLRVYKKDWAKRNGWASTKYADGRDKPKTVKVLRIAQCLECLGEYQCYSKSKRFCSNECKQSFYKKRAKEKYSLTFVPAIAIFNCQGCDKQIERRSAKMKVCAECLVIHKRAKRSRDRRTGKVPRSKTIDRARFYGVKYEHVNPFDVFARDGWKCMMCSIDLHPDKRGTFDADAPEIDHIIPISKGGDHVLTNLQASCRRCNMIKSDNVV